MSTNFNGIILPGGQFNGIIIDPALDGNTASIDGFDILIDKPGRQTSTKELSRRITRTPTLDGGAAFFYGGFTHADRSMTVELTDATDQEVSAAISAIENNNNVQIQNSEGQFTCALQRVTVKDGSVTFKLLVKEKVA